MSVGPSFQIGCCVNSFHRFGAEVAIRELAALGIRGLELPIRTPGFRPRRGDPSLLDSDASPARIASVRTQLADAGISLTACNVLSGQPLDDGVVEETFRKLAIAAEFGVSIVVGEAGRPHPDMGKEPLYDVLRTIGDRCRELGLVYCCETHPGVCQDVRSMVETMRTIDHPAVRLNFDTGNLLYFNDGANVETSLARVVRWVGSVHLKDHTGEAGAWAFPALGHGGGVDFTRVRQILRESGFRGPCNIELQGIEGEPDPSLEDIRQSIRDSLATLRVCGFFD